MTLCQSTNNSQTVNYFLELHLFNTGFWTLKNENVHLERISALYSE